MLTDAATMLISGAEKRPERQQAGLLELGLKVGTSSGKERRVAKEIATADAIPTATADQSVVAEAVEDPVTE